MHNLKAYQLAVELNQNCSELGFTGELRQQFERAVLSIALNLAEGTGRSGKDRLYHFRIAYGSCCEVKACLTIANHPLFKKADRLGGMIYKLIQRPGCGPCPWAGRLK
jgi:four helix bundle protein